MSTTKRGLPSLREAQNRCAGGQLSGNNNILGESTIYIQSNYGYQPICNGTNCPDEPVSGHTSTNSWCYGK